MYRFHIWYPSHDTNCIYTIVQGSDYCPPSAGFCKNDKDHDLHMLMVTYEVDPDTAKSRRIGEGKMPIYPRTDTYVDIDADYGEPIYQITGMPRLNSLKGL